jgi:hypothetical protein
MGNLANTPAFSTSGNLNIGGAAVANEVTIGTTASVNGGTANVAGNLIVNPTGALNVSGALNINNGTPAGTATAGNLNVTGGAGIINGVATVTGNAVVGPGGTLGGTGLLTSAGVVINGNLAPGNSPGVLDINAALNFGTNSSYVVELGGTLPGDGTTFYDQTNMINPAGSISLAPDNSTTLNVSLFGAYSPSYGDVYYVLNRADAAAFTNIFSGMPEGTYIPVGPDSVQITYQANWTGTQAGSSLTGGNDVALRFIPEPSTALLGVLASLWLFGFTRRRRKE